jgi:Mg2+-importing ATPase
MKKSAKPEARNAFWNIPVEQQHQQLSTSLKGLSSEEAELVIKRYGENRLNNKKQTGNLRLFFAQFKNSIILYDS